MLIFYYRNADGKIISHHRNRANLSEDEARQRMAEYNADPKGNGRTVYAAEVAEDSLEAYLLDCLDKKYMVAKDALDDARNALEGALDCINSLEVGT